MERVTHFFEDAQKLKTEGPTPKVAKEIAKLQKFLFNNQNYRFTERDQSHLFSTVEIYVSVYLKATDTTPIFALLEDCLKMPFTVFTTKHKNKFLTWHTKFSPTKETQQSTPAGQPYQVIEIQENGKLIVMDDDGETIDNVSVSPEMSPTVSAAFTAMKEIKVLIAQDKGNYFVSSIID